MYFHADRAGSCKKGDDCTFEHLTEAEAKEKANNRIAEPKAKPKGRPRGKGKGKQANAVESGENKTEEVGGNVVVDMGTAMVDSGGGGVEDEMLDYDEETITEMQELFEGVGMRGSKGRLAPLAPLLTKSSVHRGDGWARGERSQFCK